MKKYLTFYSLLAVSMVVTFLNACSDGDDPKSADCTTLAISVPASGRENPSDCVTSDGSITASASGGKEPYQFSLNGGAFQSNAGFVNLGAGEYSVTVKDASGCEQSVSGIVLTIPGSSIDFTATTLESGCKSGEGSLTISATGGSGNYSYRIGDGNFVSSSVFDGLTAGSKSVTVRDNGDNCSITKSINVLTGTSYTSDIQPIIEASCAVSGCHVSGGAAPFALTSVSSAQNHAAAIKTATANGSMPKSGTPLTQQQKDLIACWVDDGAPNN